MPSELTSIEMNYDKNKSKKHFEESGNGVESKVPPTKNHFTIGNGINGTSIQTGTLQISLHHGDAYRTYITAKIAEIMGVEHLLPEVNYHPDLHAEHLTLDEKAKEMLGTAVLNYIPGPTLAEAFVKNDIDSLIHLWENGDLLKLWIVHFIANNTVPSHVLLPLGVHLQVLDNTQSYFELPFGYAYKKGKVVHSHIHELPLYIQLFVSNDPYYKEFVKFRKIFHNKIIDSELLKIIEGFSEDYFEFFDELVKKRVKIIKNQILVKNVEEIIPRMKSLWVENVKD